MGRGPKPTKGKAKPAVARESRANEDARVRDLEKRLAEALGASVMEPIRKSRLKDVETTVMVGVSLYAGF